MILTIQEKIYQVQKNKQVLLLIIFDLKDIFNNIPVDILSYYLQKHRISEKYIQQIYDFYNDRLAIVTINGIISKLVSLPYISYPQGSLLLPLLIFFFNTVLIKSDINKYCKAIAFINDYSAQVIDNLITNNIDFL